MINANEARQRTLSRNIVNLEGILSKIERQMDSVIANGGYSMTYHLRDGEEQYSSALESFLKKVGYKTEHSSGYDVRDPRDEWNYLTISWQ